MSEQKRASKTPVTRAIYVRNPSRAHKVLPLLEGIPVELIKSWRDLLNLKRAPDVGTVVLVDNFGRWGVLGVLAAFSLRAPLAIRLRGEYFREERERAVVRTGLFRWPRYLGNILLARLCIHRSRMVVCNSRYLARAMEPYLSGKLVRVVHNPYTEPGKTLVRSSVPQVPGSGFCLLTITNMNLYSKVQPTVEAINEWMPLSLWEELDVHWVVCGSGYHKERFGALVREKGLEDRVHLLGRVEDVSGLYEWCDVLVHLTRMDAFPNVPMEAMLYEKPVITNSDSCGTREQVRDGENGRIVDAASFVSALKDYAEDPALRKRHGRAGREFVREHFSVEAQRPAMKRALNELLLADRGEGVA
ncbi:MAG: glycosyltransferase family 4 protein [Rubrobacteraceae bacterium]